MSDLHVGAARAAERVQRVLDYLDRLVAAPDGVLVTGDLTEHGAPAEYEELRTLLGQRSVMLCPGNHDRRGPLHELLLGEQAGAEPVNAVHELPGLRVVTCDSSIPGRDEGLLADETLDWVAAVLRGSETPTLLAFHHPPMPVGHPFMDAIRLAGAERLHDLVLEHRHVAGLLCGHAHAPVVSTFAGRPVVVAPGVASTLRLPWEASAELELDLDAPPALALHLVDPAGRLTTHVRLVP